MSRLFFKALFVMGILLSCPARANDLEEAVIQDIKTRPDRLEQFEQFGALSLSNTNYLAGSNPSREKFLGHAFDLLFDVKGQGLDAKPSPERLEHGKKWVFEIIFRHINKQLPNNGSEGFFKSLKKIDPKQARGNGDFFILFSLIAQFDSTLAFFKIPEALSVERETPQYYDALWSFLKDSTAYDQFGLLGQDAHGRVSRLFNTSEHLKAYLSSERSYVQVRDEALNFLKMKSVGSLGEWRRSSGFPDQARPWNIGTRQRDINVKIYKAPEAAQEDIQAEKKIYKNLGLDYTESAPPPQKTLKDFVLYVVNGEWPHVPIETFDVILQGTVQGVPADNSCYFHSIDGFFTGTTTAESAEKVRQALASRLRDRLNSPVIRFWLSSFMRSEIGAGFTRIPKTQVTYNNKAQLEELLRSIKTPGLPIKEACYALSDAIAYMNSWNLYELNLEEKRPELILYIVDDFLHRTTPFANRTFVSVFDPSHVEGGIGHVCYIRNPQLSFKAP